MSKLTIGRLAAEAGVGVETVRFYEREGLIARPLKPAVGYRSYPDEALRRLRFIRRAKELGFSLQEIRELLALRVRREGACAEVRERAATKLADINHKIATLDEIRASLTQLIDACDARRPTDACPVLAAIDEDALGFEAAQSETLSVDRRPRSREEEKPSTHQKP